MDIRTNKTLTTLIATLLLTLSWTLANATPAPSWSDTDTTGQDIEFPADLDRPTLLLFWATWCPYCKALMPHLQSIIDEQGTEKVQVIAVSVFEDEGSEPAAYVEKQGFQFRVVENGDLFAEDYGAKTTPALFLVSADGNILWSLADARQAEQRVAGIKNHGLRAARRAPFWAAELRKALAEVD